MTKLKQSLPVLAAAIGIYMALLQLTPKMSPEVTALVIVGTWIVAQIWSFPGASK